MPNKQMMQELIVQWHADQKRSNGCIPYWIHCQSVAEILEDALVQSGEL